MNRKKKFEKKKKYIFFFLFIQDIIINFIYLLLKFWINFDGHEGRISNIFNL